MKHHILLTAAGTADLPKVREIVDRCAHDLDELDIGVTVQMTHQPDDEEGLPTPPTAVVVPGHGTYL